MSGPRVLRHTFRAMGTDVELITEGAVRPEAFEAAARTVQAVFAEDEARFSRFNPASELSRVNASSGRWTPVSPRLAEVVEIALAAARATDGLFDPTVLGALIAAGYDRDLSAVRAEPSTAHGPPGETGGWRKVRLEEGRIKLPPSVGLDLGGLVKGWTVDRAAETARRGLPWVLVSAGGDLRLVGHAAGIDVAVEDPLATPEELLRIGLEGGALATTSAARRSWGPGAHHVIDPRTGRPATTGVVQATAWAPTCAQAEVRATQGLLEGSGALDAFPVVLALASGEVLTNLSAEAA